MIEFGKIKDSMQLKFLPLTLSGVLLGVLLAASDFKVSLLSSVLSLLTAVCIHALSRYKAGIVASVVFALLMIRASFGTLLSLDAFCIMLLVGATIVSSRKYSLDSLTVEGKKMTAIAGIMLFGLVAVLVPYFICAHTVASWYMLLPAASTGFLCTAVLKLESRPIHCILLATGWLCMTAFCLVRFSDPWHYLFVASSPCFFLHLWRLWKSDSSDLAKSLAWYTLLFALLAGFGYIKFLLF